MTDEFPAQADPGGLNGAEPLPQYTNEQPMRANPDGDQRASGELASADATRRIETFARLWPIIAEGNHDLAKIVQGTAEVAAEALGDLCTITLLHPSQDMYRVVALHDADPVALALMKDLFRLNLDFRRDEGIAATVIRTGQPLLMPVVTEEQIKATALPEIMEYIDRVGISSVLAVPITGRSGLVGTISVTRHRGGKAYDAADQAFLSGIAYRVGIAIENATLVTSLRQEVAARQFAKEALAASEERFLSIFQATTLGIQVMDLVGNILESNPALRKITGYTEQELVGVRFDMLVHPDDIGQVAKVFTAIKTTGEPQARLEHRMVRSDGTIIWVRATFAGVKKGAGDNDLALIVGIKEDITELKVAEAALVHSERSLIEAQHVARLGSLDYDITMGTVHASEEALRIFGVGSDQIYDSPSMLQLVHPDDREKVTAHSQAVLKHHVPEEFEFRVVRPDGQVVIVHDRVAPYYDEDGQPTRLLGTVRDVTEQRQAEAELLELKRHLQRNIEIERLRLAQELHDVPLQQLYTVIYKLEEMRLAAGASNADALGDLSTELNKVVNTLRMTASELRPPSLSKFGLAKAIRSYLEDFRERHPEIEIKHALAQDRQFLPEDVRLVLYRVFQGAMANALRHAQPSEISVNFTFDAEEACIEIRDNGKGFSVPANWMRLVRQGHYGLAGMAERVGAAGGVFSVVSQPGEPTTVRVAIPWSSAQSG